MFKLFYLCRERPHQETEWTDSLFSLFSLCISHFIIHERFKCMNIVILKIALFRRFTALCLTDHRCRREGLETEVGLGKHQRLAFLSSFLASNEENSL